MKKATLILLFTIAVAVSYGQTKHKHKKPHIVERHFGNIESLDQGDGQTIKYYNKKHKLITVKQ